MAHFAEINNDIVTQVLVVGNNDITDENGVEQEQLGINFLHALFGEGKTWVQTSYNGSFRKHYAGIGYTFDSVRNAFIPPKPYPSWLLNEETCSWDPPVPYPQDGNSYVWDETVKNWIIFERLNVK